MAICGVLLFFMQLFLMYVPALVRAACEYKSHIHILDGDKIVNAKSMMGVLSLGTPRGTQLVLEAEGTDEATAVHRLAPMVHKLYSD